MIHRRLECQKRKKGNDQLKNSESEVVACGYHRFKQDPSWPVNTTQRINKSCENYRELVESGTNALNFGCIDAGPSSTRVKKELLRCVMVQKGAFTISGEQDPWAERVALVIVRSN